MCSLLAIGLLTPATPVSEAVLWYRQPAAIWSEALPVGNGRIGAMIYGGTAEEHLALNEQTIWSGNLGDSDRAGAHRHLAEIRELIFAGRYPEAEAIVNREILGERPLGSYQALGDLRIRFDHAGEITDYRRALDLNTAIASVTYRAGDATFVREVYSSAPGKVLVIRLTCDKPGRISFAASLSREADAESVSPGADSIALRGQADRGKPTAGTTFASELRARAENGTVTSKDGVLRVDNADSVTLLLAAATDYRKEDPAARCGEHLAAAMKLPAAGLRAAHLADYQALFRRVDLDLGVPQDLPTDERLQRVKDGAADENLLALYFQFGRYLLISSSREGGLPANLQGIWNDKLSPPWFSGWHFDLNAQMNYWMAETTNLSECHVPLFDMIDALRVNGRKTARDVYGCPGFVVSHRTNAWWFTSPVKGLTAWPPGAGWLCQHLWEHYLFTQDREFLKTRGYPAMKEAAEFFLAWLVPDPKTGKLVSGPSISPENNFEFPGSKRGAAIDMGPAMDQQIVAELFDNCLAAAAVLGEDDAFVAQVREARPKLAGPRIASDGRLLEWSKEHPEREPGHRHMSHLYAVYPGGAITPSTTPELAEAARKSLAFRLNNGGSIDAVNLSDSGNTGWSLAWNAGLWARLGDGGNARKALVALLQRATFPNLMDAHPQKNSPGVFQIDGNFGAAAAMAEMLVQSHAGEIELLPALPPEWPEGSVRGLRLRGGGEAAVAWKAGALADASIQVAKGRKIRLRTAGPVTIRQEGTVLAQSQRAQSGWLAEFVADRSGLCAITPE